MSIGIIQCEYYNYHHRRSYVELGEIINIRQYRLNGTGRCPKCDGYLLKDDHDICCLYCGWRDSEYFIAKIKKKASRKG